MPTEFVQAFVVEKDNPFRIFRMLQDIARKKFGEGGYIDLSRGDPGYGFTPSMRGRQCSSLILELDALLNRDANHRFLLRERKDLPHILQEIDGAIREQYSKETTDRNHALFQELIDGIIEAAEGEGKSWDAFDVLFGLFASSAMSGGSYLNPKGEELTRIVVAAWHRKEYGVRITSEDLLLTSGVSHGIGTLFRVLGEEGCGFLKRGDAIVTGSPVYAPYVSILEQRGITPLTFSIHPVTGAVSALPKREEGVEPKALILIDPNNPTGFSLSPESLQALAKYAETHDLLVITDEVYSSFFPKKKSMLSLCPERVVCLNARSKIERSTGLRFGEIIILPQSRTKVASMLGLKDARALEDLLIAAKAPGGMGGEFQHTTFVPGPSQLLGITHILLGGEERKTYKEDLAENGRIFCKELGLPHIGNLYYVLFDLNTLPGCTTQNLPMEERLTKLAESGVIYIPAHRFFAGNDRTKETLTMVRASVVNTTPEKLKEAARRTREVLCGRATPS